jgi:precorrin-6A synthase
MKRVVLIGIGTGHPGHVTMEGVEALNRADVLLIPTKGEDKAALAQLRRDICDRYISGEYRTVEFALPVRDAGNPSYEAGVNDWHEAIAAEYERMLVDEMADGQTAALLVWGDPSLYDSTLRILERVAARGAVAFETEVIAGITAIQALTAAFAIPLNRIGQPVLITTGRRLADGWPEDADSVVVMLDGQETFKGLVGRGLDIWWGAYLGSADAALITGALDDVADEISAVRARARQRAGWIMDTYLLRKR